MVIVVLVIPGDRRRGGNVVIASTTLRSSNQSLEEVGFAVEVGRLCVAGTCAYAVALVLPWVLVALVLVVRCSAVTSCRVYASALLPRLHATPNA